MDKQVVTAVGVLSFLSLCFAVRVDTVLPTGSLTYWILTFCGVVSIAFYSGWTDSRLLAAYASSFVTVLWAFLVPPLFGLLYGLKWAKSPYRTVRVGDSLATPTRELLIGLKHGPVVSAVVTLVVGTAAYFAGREAKEYVAGR